MAAAGVEGGAGAAALAPAISLTAVGFIGTPGEAGGLVGVCLPEAVLPFIQAESRRAWPLENGRMSGAMGDNFPFFFSPEL
ncbi:hypothetical protein ACWNXI_15680 [Caldibacillus thermoamylovorans]